MRRPLTLPAFRHTLPLLAVCLLPACLAAAPAKAHTPRPLQTQARTYQSEPPKRLGTETDAAAQAKQAQVKQAQPQPSRPQTPRPPLPYHTQEVTLYGAGNVRLRGTLTLPRGKGPFPAALLLGGSGLQDRDNTLAGHRPFLVLADHLARAGIASLRLDDRGAGSSGGWLYHASYADLSTDAREAMAFLRRQPRVQAGGVGLIGHSEGSSIALLNQQSQPPTGRAAFAVLLAGPAVQGRDLLAGQVARDYPDARQQRQVLGRLLNDWQTSPYLRDFLAYNPAPAMRQLSAGGLPILALYGGRDTQVYRAAGYLPAWRALRGESATVTEWPGLNHLFQPAATGREEEYAHISATLEPRVMQQISQWILQQVGGHK